MKRRVRTTYQPKLIPVEEYWTIMHVVDYWQASGEILAKREEPFSE